MIEMIDNSNFITNDQNIKKWSRISNHDQNDKTKTQYHNKMIKTIVKNDQQWSNMIKRDTNTMSQQTYQNDQTWSNMIKTTQYHDQNDQHDQQLSNMVATIP